MDTWLSRECETREAMWRSLAFLLEESERHPEKQGLCRPISTSLGHCCLGSSPRYRSWRRKADALMLSAARTVEATGGVRLCDGSMLLCRLPPVPLWTWPWERKLLL
ncbi:uncharacterized protein LOC141732250 [Larus michahellis]|uniref:uncharacterized protein LOC141732250 n=1 Tax=Larus michahellis TaxID=119627 RepID=UPI003D9B06BF